MCSRAFCKYFGKKHRHPLPHNVRNCKGKTTRSKKEAPLPTVMPWQAGKEIKVKAAETESSSNSAHSRQRYISPNIDFLSRWGVQSGEKCYIIVLFVWWLWTGSWLYYCILPQLPLSDFCLSMAGNWRLKHRSRILYK